MRTCDAEALGPGPPVVLVEMATFLQGPCVCGDLTVPTAAGGTVLRHHHPPRHRQHQCQLPSPQRRQHPLPAHRDGRRGERTRAQQQRRSCPMRTPLPSHFPQLSPTHFHPFHFRFLLSSSTGKVVGAGSAFRLHSRLFAVAIATSCPASLYESLFCLFLSFLLRLFHCASPLHLLRGSVSLRTPVCLLSRCYCCCFNSPDRSAPCLVVVVVEVVVPTF